MKKVLFTDQLDLSKDIVANLTEEQLQQIEGGAGADADTSCTSGNGSCVIIIVTTTPEGVSSED